MSCKKGGFIHSHHNEIRVITAKMLDEVCNDVRREPSLTKLTGEVLQNKTSNTKDEARLDVSATGLWGKSQRVFLDIRVYDPNTLRYRNQSLKQCYSKNAMENTSK